MTRARAAVPDAVGSGVAGGSDGPHRPYKLLELVALVAPPACHPRVRRHVIADLSRTGNSSYPVTSPGSLVQLRVAQPRRRSIRPDRRNRRDPSPEPAVRAGRVERPPVRRGRLLAHVTPGGRSSRTSSTTGGRERSDVFERKRRAPV